MYWSAFCALNASRRAIRDFDGSPLADDDVRAILEQAQLAPSSANLQPYQFHWVRSPEMKAKVAKACQNQRGAVSASTLIVVAAGLGTVRASSDAKRLAETLEERPRQYHRAQLVTFGRFLKFA